MLSRVWVGAHAQPNVALDELLSLASGPSGTQCRFCVLFACKSSVCRIGGRSRRASGASQSLRRLHRRCVCARSPNTAHKPSCVRPPCVPLQIWGVTSCSHDLCRWALALHPTSLLGMQQLACVREAGEAAPSWTDHTMEAQRAHLVFCGQGLAWRFVGSMGAVAKSLFHADRGCMVCVYVSVCVRESLAQGAQPRGAQVCF